MAKKKKIILWLLALMVIAGAVGAHYAFDPWGFYHKVSAEEAILRLQVVHTAETWLGVKENTPEHRKLLSIYNSHEPLAMGYTVQDTDSWCAAFVSTVSIQLGLTDIIPTECGCQRQIELFRTMECWQEEDSFIPAPGDLIYYDWDETNHGSCTGWADHVGIVVGVKWPFIKVIEGNREDQVMYRILPLNEVTIRGFALPDYLCAA